MPHLSISDFSCIKNAVLELSPVNVIIGPQGSGKSVTTKLFYFFTDIINNYKQHAERGDLISEYKKKVAKQFSIWFPPSAWGNGRFNLNYYADPFSVRILRRTSHGRPTDEVAVTFSDWFNDHYTSAIDSFSKSRIAAEKEEERTGSIETRINQNWRVWEILERKIGSDLGSEYISSQTFIPAGRAFFTSIGRLVAGFEHAGALDPVTVNFAKLFANLRDRNATRHSSGVARLDREIRDRRDNFMATLFGGEVKFDSDLEYVETNDGRRVPFSSLSSGQQELLPMFSLVDYFLQVDSFRTSRKSNYGNQELVYIEEPEAHLFPSAQSLLMEFLIGSLVSERQKRSLIITTHSPYIMAKLNVFLKAGQLARRKKRNQDINKIIPRECWLNDRQLSAQAIEGGSLVNLIDDDGLVDSGYLDEISEEISREFSSLLAIEAEI